MNNVLKVGLRILANNKIVATINLVGLTIGILSAIVIYLIVDFEFGFNKHWKDHEKIYRIVSTSISSSGTFNQPGAPGPLAHAIKQQSPMVEYVASTWQSNPQKVTTRNRASTHDFKDQTNIIFAEPEYFSIFSYQWLHGSSTQALAVPYSVVLTKSRAQLYFPGYPLAAIIGNQIIYDDTIGLTITGIVDDITSATDFHFQEFVSFETFLKKGLDQSTSWNQWGMLSSNSQLFIKLKEKQNMPVFLKQIATLENEKRGYDAKFKYHVQPLSDFHFNQDFPIFDQRQANKSTLYGLILIGIFLIMLACFNFINLATTQAQSRSKEIGVRKTLGSSRGQLMKQFLQETFILTSISALIAILITPLILSILREPLPDGLQLTFRKMPIILLFVFPLIAVVSVLAGLYPSIVLSKVSPISSFKLSKSGGGPENNVSILFRKGLVLLQFIIAQFFVIATIFVSKQMDFLIAKDLGFVKNGILNFDIPLKYDSTDNKKYLLKKQLEQLASVSQVSLSAGLPTTKSDYPSEMKFSNGQRQMSILVNSKWIDTSFLELYEIGLLSGRQFRHTDTIGEVLINEALARKLGITTLSDATSFTVTRNNYPVTITGVIKNFHNESLYNAVQPLVLGSFAAVHGTFSIKFKSAYNRTHENEIISKVQRLFTQFYPDKAFKFTVLSETVDGFYKKERNISQILNLAAILAVIISCLGILGLVIYNTNKRIKEIAIRKILGATSVQIIVLLTRDLFSLMICSVLVTIPLCYLAISRWIEDFAYRIGLSWWLFGLGSLILISISLFTLGLKTWKIAQTNPSENLRVD